MIIKNISENNELFKNQNITLKDYLTKYNKRPSTLVKIDDQLIQVTKVEESYMDKIVDKVQFIPNGMVIYLK